MSQRILRWGILGAASIARKNWQAIHNSGNGVIAAVASRDAERARLFVQECQAEVPFANPPEALGSYETLLARPDVDAVYIPLPTGLRKEWVLRAAAAGKHVVCEKPCAIDAADLREMITACQRHNVQFMDGVMFMHSQRLAVIRAALDDHSESGIGQIKRIASAFSFCAPPDFFTSNIRADSTLEPQGCLGDLGWYCIRFTLWALGERLPQMVSGRLLSGHTLPNSAAPIPTEFSAELMFDHGVSAAFYCSFLTENQQWAHVSGTNGSLRVDDFVLPYSGAEMAVELSNPRFQVNGCHFRMEPNRRRLTIPEHSNNHPSAQETNLFRNFAAQVLSGRLNERWPERALATQLVLDACLESAQAESRPVSLASLPSEL
jgi:predicted dehydrogenase